MTPRSPWIASAGWRNNAGVPVLVSVAAILRQMMPDLPMPVRMTRPLHCRSSCTAQSKRPSRRSTSARIAAASVSSTLRARARPASFDEPASATRADLARFDDPVERDEPAEQRLELVERERVLRVALGSRRCFVHLEKHAVDARGDAGGCERLDVLGLTGGDAVARAWQLQAVR